MVSIMVFVASLILFFCLGLYSGKRRAMGREWSDIANEFMSDAKTIYKSAWKKISGPFRKGRPNEDVV